MTDAASNLNPPFAAGEINAEPPARARLALIGAVVLAVLRFIWITAHLAPAILSPDANGYVVQARLLAETGSTSFAPESAVQYVGMHWLETERGVFHSCYPSGLPLLFAGAWKIGGLGAALYVNPLLASASVFLVFLLARRFVVGVYALIAAAVVAAVPVTNIALGGSIPLLASAKISLQNAARARAVAEKEIPPGSVVIVDRQLAESLDATGQWKLVEESFLAGGGMGPGPGPGGVGGMMRPAGGITEDAPNPMQRGKNRAQQERYAGLEPGERRTRAWADLAAWAKGKPIFWYARSLDILDRALPVGADYRSIAEVDAPTMIGPGGGGGRPPGGMPGMMGPGMAPGRGGRGGKAGPGGSLGPGGPLGPGRGKAGGNFGPPGIGPGGMPGRGGMPGGMVAAPAKLRVVRIELPKG